jgi:predicted ribosomally synthesized peptide with SipW-like signal peptide
VKQVRKISTSLIIIAVLAALIAAGAMAVFTDQQTNPDNVFTTGTVILGIDPATAMFTVSNMAPGDVEYGGLEVNNDGSLELRYAMTTTADDTSTLDEQLDLTIDVVTSPGVDAIWYTDDDVVGEANIYGPDGVLSAAFFGDPAQGEQAGDRTLASLTSERLRFKATLPLDTDNSYQGTTCTVAFVFDAEQTANNP